MLGVAIALGETELTACSAFDQNHSEHVEINELVAAVANALNGCGPAVTIDIEPFPCPPPGTT